MIWLHAYPLLPPLPSVSRLAAHRKTEKERQHLSAWRGRGGGQGAKSFDRKKAWSSINHLILSAPAPCMQEGSQRSRIPGTENYSSINSPHLKILPCGIFIVKIYILFKIQAASPQAYSFNFSEMGIWPSR
jgi:hypothetical protein